MSWLRTTSLSFARQISRSLDPRHDYEPQACYNSFCKHWQQVHDIILKSQPQHLHDDVLGVVNHLEQLSTLLVLEAKVREFSSETSPAACLEYLLSENLLDKLYEWAICTGKYENAVRLEQLKLYSNLVSQYSSQVIAAEPFLRPLLKLLSGFRNELPPSNVESQLVVVLNQLCIALVQNIQLVDLFFLTTHTHNGSRAEFILVRLLLASVHREGATGSVARDALLLCADMSARCEPLAEYMLAGNTCVVLATGLSGLYSLLPQTLHDKVYRLTPDDVNQVHKLTLFIDSLEFCNAVAQVAHPSIKKYLLDLLLQGFLVPVMGPALLQSKAGRSQSGAAEQAAAMAYLELLLRCVTPKGLLGGVLQYLLTYEYDGIKVIDVLLTRLEGNSQLSLVALSLMETLIDLNCEDVMLELVFKYLLNGQHVMPTHRHRVADPDAYREAAVTYMTLSPRCCSRPLQKTRQWVDELALSGRRVLDFKSEGDGKRVNGFQENIAMNNLVQEVKFNYGNPNETLVSNYHAYLCDARFEIVSRTIACAYWSSKYDTIVTMKKETTSNISDPLHAKEQDSLISVSGYDTLKNIDNSEEKEPHSLTSLTEQLMQNCCDINPDSLTSIGESSGYDSFSKYKVDDEDEFAEELFAKSLRREERKFDHDVPLVRNYRASAQTIIGPLLGSLLRKTALLLESDITTNFLVTGIVTKLATLPAPLLTSLLCVATTVPNVPSLIQILSKLKEEVDELIIGMKDTGEFVDQARVFLIQREMMLVKTRGPTNEESHPHSLPQETGVRFEESTFRRSETKRRSISSSISNMFANARRLSSSPSQSNSLIHQNVSYNSSPQKRLVFTQEAYWDQSITLRSILNAVILDEWIKELAAICEEHALRLSAQNYEDNAYVRSVAL